ncbi:probable serine/threonine-protein kinase At1g09600 [Eutrema salsugineum]|uniref:probable serine/threonine-protein kinase At1g09600 n=1 Tax=Eutrema salsugineum TaxID=72664 RepID=UPI000CECE3FC|nr:probable serine/threonine-protein kinase At1g09600 [Eutrema salsugineum]XP_024009995.1 probable serine/threonine-protein kinase At1g09600 [Eutrema salsugineum]
MGCICSKGTAEEEVNVQPEKQNENWYKTSSSVQLIAPTNSKKEDFSHKSVEGSSGGRRADGLAHKPSSRGSGLIVPIDDSDGKTVIVERPTRSHRRCLTTDIGTGGGGFQMFHQPSNVITSVPHSPEAELIAAGWPSWLTSVAGEAIKGWVPRPAESFEKLEKIGQGTYSSVYRARDLETGKTVAMKKVRFVNMDPESVRFMAREINILRKLDHPNVMKLECLVTSKLSGSLYLVFEYMEHDLSGLALRPGVKFTESQIKCYMKQLLSGLEHCHSRGILHRDIKGSNLLVNNDGVLKIGDFGLANFYHPDQDQPLTSRVVTLWYRAPELLLGATEYGAGIDLWSVGCILTELFLGKPIMPGRTEVEQMHKIFKLCGSPSDDYWKKKKLPLATSFKPQQPYKRVLLETFKSLPSSALALVDKLLSLEPEKRGSTSSTLNSKFFTTEPLPCDVSSLPKYPPSKELDAKVRDEEARRKRAETVKGRGPESVRRGSRDFKSTVTTPEFIASGQSKVINPQEDSRTGLRGETGRCDRDKGFSHTNSMIHPSITATWSKNESSRNNVVELKATRSSNVPMTGRYLSPSHKDDAAVEPTATYIRKKNRMHYSGPLMPPGGNIEDILKEHERQIQEAVRKSRLEKSATKKNHRTGA